MTKKIIRIKQEINNLCKGCITEDYQDCGGIISMMGESGLGSCSGDVVNYIYIATDNYTGDCHDNK